MALFVEIVFSLLAFVIFVFFIFFFQNSKFLASLKGKPDRMIWRIAENTEDMLTYFFIWGIDIENYDLSNMNKTYRKIFEKWLQKRNFSGKMLVYFFIATVLFGVVFEKQLNGI